MHGKTQLRRSPAEPGLEKPRVLTHRSRTARLGIGVAVVAFTLTACGGGSTKTQGSGTTGGDHGLTGTPIKIGNVVDLTGPIPGLFKGAREASEAYVDKINSSGGLNGHPVQLVTGDSQTTCNGATAAWGSVMPQVQAMVGSISGLDSCAAKALNANPKIPAVFEILNPVLSGIPNTFAPSPRPLGQSVGQYRYISEQHPGAIKKMGFIANTVTEYVTIQAQTGLKKIGAGIAYTRTTDVTKQTDFTSDIIKMRAAGVKWLSLDGMPIDVVSRILNNAKQQHWRPEVITALTAYDGNFLKIADPAAVEGLYMPMQTAMFLGEDRKTSVGVDEYLTWLDKVHPGAKPDLFGAEAWASWELWYEAWQKAGGTKSPDDVRFALGTITTFDAKGLLPPASPTARTPALCWMVAQIKNDKFVRVEPADKGFSCAGGEFVPLGG
jgi:ABC-type branched-subunit amino acid transport system substrate-binding protein